VVYLDLNERWPPRKGRGALYRGDVVGARHCHVIDPHQLLRSPLDELT
jgi:hypothetical protein